MTQDMSNKMIIEDKKGRTLFSIFLLMMLTLGVSTVWGQTNVYIYMADGHYLAHCGKDVSLSTVATTTALTEFNPNTCLWEAIPNPNKTSETFLRAYGTETLTDSYYLNISAVTDYYSTVITKAGRNVGNSNTLPRLWPTSLIGTSGYPAHYLCYHYKYGWIAAENITKPYNKSVQPTIKAVTITSDVGTYYGPQVSFTGASELSDFGTYDYSADTSIEEISYPNYTFDDTDHYWYDNSDHGSTEPEDWSGTLTSSWSIAENGGYATIDETGTVTVHKLPTNDLTLSIQLTVTDGTHSCVFSKFVILKGGRRVLMDNEGRYLQASGNNVTSSTSFAPTNTVWQTIYIDYANNNYTINSNSTLYYLYANNKTKVGLYTTNGDTRWWKCAATGEIYNSKGGIYYAYWDDTQNLWALTSSTSIPENCVVSYPVIIENVVNSFVNGDEEISFIGNYSYSSTANFTVPNYQIYTFNGADHYWYDGNDHNIAPDFLGDVDENGLTKTWALEGGDGYASFNDETEELVVTALPTTGSILLILTCTITYSEQTSVIKKLITLKPKEVKAPQIVNDNNSISIGSLQPGATCYYETGASEPLTKNPTTSSTEYTGSSFTIDNNTACIKAYVVGADGSMSEVVTYNILYFSDEKTIGFNETVTLAPLVYSSDLKTPDGMTAYIVSRVTPLDYSAILTELDYIPKNVPVLLLDDDEKRTGSTGIVFAPKDKMTKSVSTSVTNANQLKVAGKDGVPVNNAEVYMYYDGEFVLTLGGTLKNGRFYLYNPNYKAPKELDEEEGQGGTEEQTEPNSARATLRLVIEDSTGINSVQSILYNPQFDDIWYSIDGRRLSGKPDHKGFYINNGRKVVIH